MLLILFGAIIMLLSICKYHSTIHLAQSFIGFAKKKATAWYKIHHLLMIFFLFGYLAILFLIAMNIRLANDLFTGVIFFFGAGFVYIGIVLQTRMLRSIKKQHQELIRKNKNLGQVEDATIYALASLAEMRDEETGKHIERTSKYVRLLSENLSKTPNYSNHLTFRYIEDLAKAAPLHDIGKVGVPDAILRKPGKLTDDEFERMKQHSVYGANVLKEAEKKLKIDSYFSLAIPLVMSHHERWDGSGYPQQLKGDAIPLSAQIMAVADVYDALRSKRCYKQGMSHKKSCTIIFEEKGKHFSPDVVEAFRRVSADFETISNDLAD